MGLPAVKNSELCTAEVWDADKSMQRVEEWSHSVGLKWVCYVYRQRTCTGRDLGLNGGVTSRGSGDFHFDSYFSLWTCQDKVMWDIEKILRRRRDFTGHWWKLFNLDAIRGIIITKVKVHESWGLKRKTSKWNCDVEKELRGLKLFIPQRRKRRRIGGSFDYYKISFEFFPVRGKVCST